VSAESSERPACFKAAACEVLPPEARATTKVLLSDSPSTLEQCAADVFPNLQGVVEDGMHLAFRVEACTGEKRTSLSRRIILLHQKFRAPAAGAIYHGDVLVHGREGQWRPDGPRAQVHRSWRAYSKKPYTKHQEYIDDLLHLTRVFNEDMARKNDKGRTVLEIIQSGASYRHYGYLRNGSVIAHKFPEQPWALMGWGTTKNEALHFQLETVMRTVVQQHEDLMEIKGSTFAMTNMLAHNSAAYHPTLMQCSQKDLLGMIEGSLSRAFFPESNVAPTPVSSREQMRGHGGIKSDAEKKKQAKVTARKRKEMWVKQKEIDGPRKNPRREKKVTVFTKEKQAPLRRKPAAARDSAGARKH